MHKYHNEKTLHVKQVSIVVSDLERSLSFYTDLIGLTVLKKAGSEAYLGADGKNPFLVLKEVKGARPSEDNVGLYHFALLLPDRASFAQFLTHLAEEDYPVTGLSDHGISEAVYLDDPDGNGIEVAVDRYDESGNVLKLDRFGPKMVDLDDLLQNLQDLEFTKLPAETILGHLHLHVSGIEEAKRFFVQGLGFAIQFNHRNLAVFVSSGDYHHHIGFNVWNGKDAKRRAEDQAGLESYVLSAPQEELSGMISRLEGLGYAVTASEGWLALRDVNGDLLLIEGR
jgi:catechol 2,3-dioxygenase